MTDTDTENGRLDAADRVTAAIDTSRVTGVVRRALGEDSRSSAVRRQVWRTVQQSFAYRWLTKEPEPEVVVIDLRETYTIGPFVRLLDSFVDSATPYWQDSRLKRGLDRIERVFKRTAETRVGRHLVSLFAPPEPRERDEDTDR